MSTELSHEEILRYSRHLLIPEVGLEGAPFDEVSWIYPFRIPREPRVVVLAEDPRCVSVGVHYTRGQNVGVVGDAEMEEACTAHPGAFLYVVSKIQERRKGDRTYLNVRPRGWFVVDVTEKMRNTNKKRG